MKARQYGIKVNLSALREPELQMDISCLIRNINQRCHRNGFAGNKGLTDSKVSNVFGFSWYLSSERKRDIAYRALLRILPPNLVRKMRVELLESPTAKKHTFYKRIRG